ATRTRSRNRPGPRRTGGSRRRPRAPSSLRRSSRAGSSSPSRAAPRGGPPPGAARPPPPPSAPPPPPPAAGAPPRRATRHQGAPAGGTEPIVLYRTGVSGRSYTHHVVEIGANARATLVIDHRGLIQVAANIEFIVGDGASLSVVAVNACDTGSIQLSSYAALV